MSSSYFSNYAKMPSCFAKCLNSWNSETPRKCSVITSNACNIYKLMPLTGYVSADLVLECQGKVKDWLLTNTNQKLKIVLHKILVPVNRLCQVKFSAFNNVSIYFDFCLIFMVTEWMWRLQIFTGTCLWANIIPGWQIRALGLWWSSVVVHTSRTYSG